MVQLIHLSHPYQIGDNLLMMDVARQAHRRGDSVKMLLCDSTVDICTSNIMAEKAVCAWCKWYRKRFLRLLPGDIEILRFGDFHTPEDMAAVESLKFDYAAVDDIKKLTYENVNIGYGAFSSYVSLTRNLNPKIDGAFRSYFDRYLKAECVLIDVLRKALPSVRPDIVSVYNGRHFETRPVFEYAKNFGCVVRCYENVRYARRNVHYYYYENHLPHDIRRVGDAIRKTWDSSDKTEDEKAAIGNKFFVNRRNAVFAGDRVYVKGQKFGSLPAGFDTAKRNIAIYLSSEDEFAAIGGDYEKGLIFPSQYLAIREILERFKDRPDFHFYIRIHPNLKDVRYKYHTSLVELGDLYANAAVIKADEEVSSYSLLDNCEKVIVFGSTVGIEACYWGKPVILLRNAFYNELDVCYRPRSVEEAYSLIAANDLPVKDRAGTLRYGFHHMYDRGGGQDGQSDPDDFIFITKHIKSAGKHLTKFVRRNLPRALNILAKMGLHKRAEVPAAEEQDGPPS